MLSNTVLSFIRTFVPIVVGFLVAWAQPFGIEVDTEAAIAMLTAVSTAAYYTVARLLESKWENAGWLLGAAKQPIYATPPVPDQPLN